MAQQRIKPVSINELLEDVKPASGKNLPTSIRNNRTIVQSIPEFVGKAHAQLRKRRYQFVQTIYLRIHEFGLIVPVTK